MTIHRRTRIPGRRARRLVGARPSTTAARPITASDRTAEPTRLGAVPDSITIGYQLIPNGDLIVKHEGWLEEAFGPDVDIEWKLFDSGGAVNEAVIAGGIDIGLAGSSPVSRGISNGIEYQVPWIFDVIGEAEALVVRADAGIADIADLRRQDRRHARSPRRRTTACSPRWRVPASTRPTSTSSMPSPTRSTPRGRTATSTPPTCGTRTWPSSIADGGTVLITSADLAAEGKTTYDLAVVTNDFAAEYPDAVRTVGRAAGPRRRSCSTTTRRRRRDPRRRAQHHAGGGQGRRPPTSSSCRPPSRPARTTSAAACPPTCSPRRSSTRSSARSRRCRTKPAYTGAVNPAFAAAVGRMTLTLAVARDRPAAVGRAGRSASHGVAHRYP